MKTKNALFIAVIGTALVLTGNAFGGEMKQVGCSCPDGKGRYYTVKVPHGTDCNQVCNGNSGGSSGYSSGGGLTPQQELAIGITNELLKGLIGTPESRAAQRAAEEARRRKEEEERRRREEEELKRIEEIKQRLLGKLKNLGGTSQIGLKGIDSGPGLRLKGVGSGSSGLSLKTDDLYVRETRGALGQKELKPIIGDSDAGAIKVTDKNTEDSAKAGQGFDTAGTILRYGPDPTPPPVPPTKSVSPAKLEKLNTMKASLKKTEDEENALKAQLEELNQSPSPDKNAIKDVREKITVKQEEKKEKEKEMVNAEATDDDAASNQ